VLTNIKQLDNAEGFFRDYAPRARTALGAIEIARGTVSPDYRPAGQPQLGNAVPAHFPVQAGPYLEAVDRFGSFAFSGDELLQQDVALREAADRVLASAERLSLLPLARPPAGSTCAQLSGAGAVRELSPGQVFIQASQPAKVRLGRFATGYPVDLGDLARGETAGLTIPRDADARPWRISIAGGGSTRICSSPG
jgi:hypothetical protein